MCSCCCCCCCCCWIPYCFWLGVECSLQVACLGLRVACLGQGCKVCAYCRDDGASASNFLWDVLPLQSFLLVLLRWLLCGSFFCCCCFDSIRAFQPVADVFTSSKPWSRPCAPRNVFTYSPRGTSLKNPLFHRHSSNICRRARMYPKKSELGPFLSTNVFPDFPLFFVFPRKAGNTGNTGSISDVWKLNGGQSILNA